MSDNSRNDSSSGGYLDPLPKPFPEPLNDDELDALLQGVIVALTNLDGAFVRPRWQTEAPNQPAVDVNWISMGVTDFDPDTYGYVKHDGTGDGFDHTQRHESFNVLCSFYGPKAGRLSGIVRDGLILVDQNREVLKQNGIDVVEVTKPVVLSELVNALWYRRIDQTIVLRRQVDRVYGVRTVLSFVGKLITDTGIERDVSVIPPTPPPPP